MIHNLQILLNYRIRHIVLLDNLYILLKYQEDNSVPYKKNEDLLPLPHPILLEMFFQISSQKILLNS